MRTNSVTKRKILIIVENLPVPFDSRVWKEACALRDAGYQVCVLSPRGRGYATEYEASRRCSHLSASDAERR